jgi:uncharacterized membrane protein YidH (DUF202 family)
MMSEEHEEPVTGSAARPSRPRRIWRRIVKAVRRIELRWLRLAAAVLAAAVAVAALIALLVSDREVRRHTDVFLGVACGVLVLLGFALHFLIRNQEDAQESRDDLKASKEQPTDADGKALDNSADWRRLETLLRDRERLRGRVRAQVTLRTLFTLAILGNAAAGAVYAFEEHEQAIGFGGVMLVLLLGLQVTRDRARELEAEVRQLDYETAIIDAGEAKKAETLFLKHQFEVRRYYDQALRQGASSFALGVVILALGAGVAITALVLIATSDPDTGQTVTLGGLASVSGIMTGFVARTYFKIHGTANDAVKEFHKRLVDDHNIHFAYLLVQRSDRVEELSAELGLSLAGRVTSDVGAMMSVVTPDGASAHASPSRDGEHGGDSKGD